MINLQELKKLNVTERIKVAFNFYLNKFIEASGFRDPEDIFKFILESGYGLLHWPVRLLIKEDIFIETILNTKEELMSIITVKLIKNDKSKRK